ncbi:cell envelope integrity protein CreD [Chitinophaga sp. sic0106]|uniref:cell envelope integrity protein CreD n=1 Tax=Chitinophaga sp. sic0106 TaxID=2854785 RepID=UPI001C46FC46|nr:cell envelope integrity protein CreD [Chitinophaga sp. sic0106]MBV7533695.1 cell envelope integrity protein CreD [Chitinophaga sp. sic0106]
MENSSAPLSFFDRFAYAIKAAFIFFLMIILLVPTFNIGSLVDERNQLRQGAAAEIARTWGGEQRVLLPQLSIPYQTRDSIVHDHVFSLNPRSVKVDGNVKPSELKRGIYTVTVYDTKMQISGSFSLSDLKKSDDSPSAIFLEKTKLYLSLEDIGGIYSQPKITWNGQPLTTEPNVSGEATSAKEHIDEYRPAGNPGIVEIAVPAANLTEDVNTFTIDMDLKGSTALSFLPTSKNTEVSLQSTWDSPNFYGDIPPHSREVSKSGFTAKWIVQNMNWNPLKPMSFNMNTKQFGVKLITPVDVYQQSARAIKYAFLIIGITFFLYYFVEIAQRRTVHPIQYGLIGIALSVFYILLLSLSEHTTFLIAYITASAMTIGLIVLYTCAVLTRRIGFTIGGLLALFYTFIYVIISAEDYALLMGSFGLFFTLAGIMYYSRKINWSRTQPAAVNA